MATTMPAMSARLVLECRSVLRLSQREFAELLGKNKRTIQRWEDGGTSLVPSEAEELARALKPLRPDLAAEVLAASDREADESGDAVDGKTISKPVASVLRAAADVMRLTPKGVRPAITAAFARAEELGLDVHTVLVELAKER